MRWAAIAAVLAVLGGCGRIAFDPFTDAGASTDAGDGGNGDTMAARTCTPDDFNAGALSRWVPYTNAGGFAAQFVAGELQITLPASSNGYAGVESIPATQDLTGVRVSVESLAVVATGNLETYMLIYVDPNNWYGFDYDFGVLRLARRVAGVDVEITVAPDPVAQRFWQMEHFPATSEVAFSVSPDRVQWTEHYRIAATVPVTNMGIEIAAGAYSGGEPSPGMPRFDNFELCLP
jgi:hypothetical protein